MPVELTCPNLLFIKFGWGMPKVGWLNALNHGQTLEEARKMDPDTIRCALESALKVSEPTTRYSEAVTEWGDVTLP